jgi:hypothetical protein
VAKNYPVSAALTDQYAGISNYGTESPQRTAIVCTNVNGGHYALRATKTDADPTTHVADESYYGAEVFGMPSDGPRVGGTPNPGEFGFNDMWGRIRFRFSAGFNVDDQGDSNRQDYIWLCAADGKGSGPTTTFRSHAVIGGDLSAGLFSAQFPAYTYPLTGDLEVFQSAQAFLNRRFYRETIVAAADIFDGNAHELVVHAKDDGTGWRVRYWYGDAFADNLALVFDNTLLYDSGVDVVAPYDTATFDPIQVNNLMSGPTSGTSQWHELHEWEYADGSVHANPYGVP